MFIRSMHAENPDLTNSVIQSSELKTAINNNGPLIDTVPVIDTVPAINESISNASGTVESAGANSDTKQSVMKNVVRQL